MALAEGVNFAVLCRHGTAVWLVLYPLDGEQPLAEITLDPLKNRTGNHWHIQVAGLPPAFRYGWRVDGPRGGGHRFDPSIVLLDPAATALLLDSEGHVTETAGANFLVVREGTVLTPPRSSVLGGISLQTTEELCSDLNIPFREQPLTIMDCLAAEEALLTSTPYGIAGVSRINVVALPWPGPVLGRLLDAWDRRVGLNIRAQILAGR